MDEDEDIQQLIRRSEHLLNDAACLPVIRPTDQDIDSRAQLVGDRSSLPLPAPGRNADPVGLSVVENASGRGVGSVRTNFFPINTQNLPSTIYHYNVSIFKIHYNKTRNSLTPEQAAHLPTSCPRLEIGGVVVKGEQREEDAAKERDSAYTTNVLKRFLDEMGLLVGWSQDPAVGYE